MKYENANVDLLEAQLVTGKAIIESVLELISKKGQMKSVIPMTFDDNKFEIEVRMK